jgi:thiol-disulfide isomerase/thioredoxin
MPAWNRAFVCFCLTVIAMAAPATAQEYLTADWTLPTAGGGTVSLHEQLAKGPVVVSFWALWCNPCLKELPQMNMLAGEFTGKVTFISVNVDNSKSVAKVQPYVQSHGYDAVIVALDTGGEVQQMMQVGGMMPFVVLFAPDGSEVYRHIGYKEGDENELRATLEEFFAAPPAPVANTTGQGVNWREALSVRDQFKYKFDTDSEAEQVENWLDVVYLFGDFRTGLLLNHQAPSEEGYRRNQIKHRFFEFNSGDVFVRAGHFYGLIGRGLVYNGYEERNIRVDTSLDGIYARGSAGPATVQVFSGATGTTSTLDAASGAYIAQVDVRGLDTEVTLPLGFKVGAGGLTYEPKLVEHEGILREWVGAARGSAHFGFGDAYLEYGHKTGFETAPTTLGRDPGDAYYGNVNLYTGPVSLSVERSDYQNFAVIPGSDGKQPLNRPPALVREHIYTLLNRVPHNLDPKDEKGWQVEGNYAVHCGWQALVNASQIKNHSLETVWEEIYGHIGRERLGDFRFRTGFGYRDSEGAIRQTVIGELTWRQSDEDSWTLQAEHQHVRMGVLGEYDQEWFKLEYELAPAWAFDAILETNNKYDAQLSSGEIPGSTFPAGQVTYTLAGGGNLNVWFGKRQAGYLCSGGVCKFEPAFEGVEFFGAFRY